MEREKEMPMRRMSHRHFFSLAYVRFQSIAIITFEALMTA